MLHGRDFRWDRVFAHHSPSASALTANAQLLLHIQPVYPLVVDHPPFAHQQHLQPAVAEPAPFFGQLAQPHSQLAVLRPSPIPIRPTMNLDQPAGASLRDRYFRAHHYHCLLSQPRAHHFFATTACNARLSSSSSATVCLSWWFSSSSCRSRFASLTS